MFQIRKLTQLHKYPGNPRIIQDKALEDLAKSLKGNSEYFNSRPLILSNRTGKLVILAGNQKYEAAKLAGLKQVPTFLIENLTEKQEQEIVIRDNAHAGEWDFDELRENWGHLPLGEWMANEWGDNWDNNEHEGEEQQDSQYTKKIETPIYEPKNEKPAISELFNKERYLELIKEIETSNISEAEKDFLRVAASRHIVFNYEKIADFYAHSNPAMQNQMENSALVIIDFEKAIELGYVKLSEEIASQYLDEYGDEE